MTMPIRVLHVRASNFLGGPERQILRYAGLDRSGETSTTIASFAGEQEGREFLAAAFKQGLETLELPTGSVAALQALLAELKQNDYDLVCSHGYKADILANIAGRKAGVPVASFLRGWTREDLTVRAYEFLNRLAIRLSWRVVALSQTQALRLRHMSFIGEKVRVVRNAIEPAQHDTQSRQRARNRLIEQFELPESARIVACAGRLSPEKGTEFFVRAAAEVLPAHPEAYFVVFGGGVLLEPLRELAARLGIEPRLIFAGHVKNLAELMPGLDVMVNPSLSEEMPNAVLESMAAGIPVIATTVGGVCEIAGEAPTLRLVPPGDSMALASAVEGLLNDFAAARQLGIRGQRQVRSAYSTQAQAAEFRELIHELGEGNRFEVLGTAAEEVFEEKDLPTISIVLPVRNEESHIGAVLAALLEQDYPNDRFEILVADGRSTDKTREVVRQVSERAQAPVLLLDNPKRLSSAGRNVGARASRGEIVGFVDGHCEIPTPRLLRNIAEAFAATGASCLCRPQPLYSVENTFLQDAIADCRASWLGHGRGSAIYDLERSGFVDPTSSGATYKAGVFRQVGYYDESFDACEDVEFNHRVKKAGLLAYSNSKLSVFYHPRKTLAGLWKQMMRYGRGRYRLMRKHPDAGSGSQLVPAALVLSAVAGAVLAPWAPRLALAPAALIGAYLVAVVVASVGLAAEKGARYLWTAPLVFTAIHFGLGAGFLLEIVNRRRSAPGGEQFFIKQEQSAAQLAETASAEPVEAPAKILGGSN